MLWIALAVVFLVVLFVIKNRDLFKKPEIKIGQNQGLASSTEILENLVNQDTDGDGIPDWEESLWGTDPKKKETTPGIPDSVAIEKLKPPTEQNEQGESSLKNEENLTETDKFSREFFSTTAALNQNGALDQATVDQLGTSLAEHIQNSIQRKIFTLTDIKIIKDYSIKAIKKYDTAMDSLYYKKYPITDKTVAVLKEFLNDGDNINVDVLEKLNPIIKQIKEIIDGMTTVSVPIQFSTLHLDILNNLEKINENLNDIKLFNSDPIMTLGAISKYGENTNILEISINKLGIAIWNKLNN